MHWHAQSGWTKRSGSCCRLRGVAVSSSTQWQAFQDRQPTHAFATAALQLFATALEIFCCVLTTVTADEFTPQP